MAPLDIALRYTRRGWSVIPVPHRCKNPGFDDWQQMRLREEDLPHQFNGQPQNIGVLMGGPSKWLVDVDLDHLRAVELADAHLPPTPLEFGRPSKPRSHRLYRVTAPIATKKFKSKSAGMIVELRSTGSQTVMPYSTHEHGELIEWVDESAEPTEVDPHELLKAVESLAITVKVELGEKAAPKQPKQQRKRSTSTVPTHSSPQKMDRCVAAMLRMNMIDHNDGSSRLFAAACRAVDHDLSDADAIAAIRQYARQRPFPTEWSDQQIHDRVRDAERKTRRGAAAAGSTDTTPNPDQIVEFPEPMRLAEHYLIRRRTHGDGLLTLRRYREGWWLFEQGGYRPLADEVALVDLYQHLDQVRTPVRDPFSGQATGGYEKLIARGSLVNEVARAIPACGAMVDGEIPQWLDGRAQPDPRDVVAFRNGLLDTATYCHDEIRLLPLTPAWFSGVACPYELDPTASCPNWLGFLQQALDGDPQSIALLQEWLGLNLVPDNQYERLLMLVGPPRSGKGTVLEVMGAMLGEGQAATTSFTKLASRFGLAPLVGKLAAILPDAHIGSSTDAKAALEVLKSITGNDPQAIDRKGIEELPRVRLFCRFSIAVNELPKLPDEAGALKTRLLLLHFRNSFAGREDTTLKTRLKAEAPGVAVWALQGLKRLRERGSFTVPARSAAMIDAFEKIVSPVLGFLDDCCEVISGDESAWVDKDQLYATWRTWCQDRGTESGSKADFGQALLNASRGIGTGRRGPKGQQFRVYTGVRVCN